MIWLTEKQIILIHSQLSEKTGGKDGLRDFGLLESALASPLQAFSSVELYPTVIEKSVRLATGLTQNHPFFDGNKRIGAHAMLLTLRLNGVSLRYTQDELAKAFLSLADGKIGYEELLEKVKSFVTA